MVNADNGWISTQLRGLLLGNNVPLASALSITLTIITAVLVYIYLRFTDTNADVQRYIG
jgi:ABC-type spermidine/putrescine transport system permease subunit I